MKRAGLLLAVALMILLGTSTAEAFHGYWRHHHWGHRHFGGGGAYRHWGGYRPYWGGVSISIGRPYYGYGWGYRPHYWNAYRPLYGHYGYHSFYRPYAYSSFYYRHAWPSYYYSAPHYYHWPSYDYEPAYSYPAYSYPACYFSSAPTVNINRLIVLKSDDLDRRLDPAPKAAIVRTVRVDLLPRARQLIRLGDAAFLEGRYVDALSRYRTAAETAPDYAEAHFRKGHAYIALGKYPLASTSFRKALRLDPSARRDGFKLDDLYGAGSIARGVHLENLAAMALMREDSPDSYFLLGLMLHFGGEDKRAEKFFARAAELSAETREAVAGFLPVRLKEAPVSFASRDEI